MACLNTCFFPVFPAPLRYCSHTGAVTVLTAFTPVRNMALVVDIRIVIDSTMRFIADVDNIQRFIYYNFYERRKRRRLPINVIDAIDLVDRAKSLINVKRILHLSVISVIIDSCRNDGSQAPCKLPAEDLKMQVAEYQTVLSRV